MKYWKIIIPVAVIAAAGMLFGPASGILSNKMEARPYSLRKAIDIGSSTPIIFLIEYKYVHNYEFNPAAL